MSDFRSKLQSLVSLEMSAARRSDPAGMASMIEALSNSLGLVVAVAAKGEPAATQELMIGVEGYLYEAVTQHSPLARLLPEAR